jgi:hypothetical protein
MADKLTPDSPAGDDPYEGMTKEELLEEARKADIEGRSERNKEELTAALRDAEGQHARG